MGKKSTSVIILFIALVLFIILDKLGFVFVGKIVGGLFTIASLILNISNIKAMNKKLLATVITITTIPVLLVLYAMSFHGDSIYWLFGSLTCFFISFPISLVIVLAYRKKVQNKLN